MQKLITWIGNPQTSSIIILALCIFVASLFIWQIFQSRKRTSINFYSKIKSPSLFGVYIIILILIAFATFAICYISSKYNRYLDMLGKAQLPLTDLTILDMQANTLTISTLVVTIASIVLTILTLYKERKAEINSRSIEEGLAKIQQAEKAIKDLSDIVSLTFVQENQRECYYDAVTQLFDQINTDNSQFYNHFRIAQISLINNFITGKKDRLSSLTPWYDEIIQIAEQIISSGDVTELDSQFAYLEALHALYLKIKNGVQTDTGDSVENDIHKAFKYIKKVEKTLSEDTLGHIANLNALTHLWSGMYKLRHGDNKEGLKMLEEARRQINEALNKNIDKIEFLNHKSVILQQLYDINGEEELHEELLETYKRVLSQTDGHKKINLNYAGTIIRDVKKVVGVTNRLDEYPDFRQLERIGDTCFYDKQLEEIKKAKALLINNIRIDPYFINNFYKLGEAITVQLAIQKYGKDEIENPDQLIADAKKAFQSANKLSTHSRPCKLCECAFYRLIGDEDKANDLKDATTISH